MTSCFCTHMSNIHIHQLYKNEHHTSSQLGVPRGQSAPRFPLFAKTPKQRVPLWWLISRKLKGYFRIFFFHMLVRCPDYPHAKFQLHRNIVLQNGTPWNPNPTSVNILPTNRPRHFSADIWQVKNYFFTHFQQSNASQTLCMHSTSLFWPRNMHTI